jgi:hypothetical protein
MQIVSLFPLAITALIIFVLLVLLSGVRIIPNNRVGIVEKKFSGKGSVKSGFIALNNEAGFQPQVLRGGIHYLMPFQYVVVAWVWLFFTRAMWAKICRVPITNKANWCAKAIARFGKNPYSRANRAQIAVVG